MTLVRRTPRMELDVPRFMDRWFNDAWRDTFADWNDEATVWSPRVDIRENKDAYEVVADIPGMNKKDIKISMQDNTLTLEGERNYENEENNEQHHRIERSYGRFSRTFHLPEKVRNEDIKAEYKDGVLRITLNKSEEVKPRQIEIK